MRDTVTNGDALSHDKDFFGFTAPEAGITELTVMSDNVLHETGPCLRFQPTVTRSYVSRRTTESCTKETGI